MLVIKNLPVNAGHARDVGLIPGSGRFPESGKWQPSPIFLPGKSYGQRSQAGYLLHMHTHTAHSAAKGDKGAFLTPHSLDTGVRETILNNQYYVKWYID